MTVFVCLVIDLEKGYCTSYEVHIKFILIHLEITVHIINFIHIYLETISHKWSILIYFEIFTLETTTHNKSILTFEARHIKSIHIYLGIGKFIYYGLGSCLCKTHLFSIFLVFLLSHRLLSVFLIFLFFFFFLFLPPLPVILIFIIFVFLTPLHVFSIFLFFVFLLPIHVLFGF